jgi:hypothetical protein
MQVVFEYNYDELIGSATLEPDGELHIRLYDPRIINEYKKLREFGQDPVISLGRVPREE